MKKQLLAPLATEKSLLDLVLQVMVDTIQETIDNKDLQAWEWADLATVDDIEPLGTYVIERLNHIIELSEEENWGIRLKELGPKWTNLVKATLFHMEPHIIEDNFTIVQDLWETLFKLDEIIFFNNLKNQKELWQKSF